MSRWILLGVFTIVALWVVISHWPVEVGCQIGIDESACAHITTEYVKQGIKGGMEAITSLYINPEFGKSGCFRYAMQVGDLAYSDLLKKRFSLNTFNFTGTNSCSFGFYHSFVANIIRDNPTPEQIDETCAALNKRLLPLTQQFNTTCYLGAGHGLTAAQAPSASGTSTSTFVTKPLSICNQVSQAKDSRLWCKRGVFETFFNYATWGKYDLAFNPQKPFALCEGLTPETGEACYWQAAQLVDKVVGQEPSKLLSLIAPLSTANKETVFTMSIAMMTIDIVHANPVNEIFAKCRIADAPLDQCVQGLIQGLFVNGEPEVEYKPAFTFCASAEVEASGMRTECYNSTSRWLQTFYSDKKLENLCLALPSDFYATCKANPSGLGHA